ncbi:hypothetical protein EJ03DRAFT_276268 [Teratosphaeria nubilosa]|uniref:BTB domain-containing protein n=1 Tax=Teratosphaeria nubilosa TaxID=161662 RepID=A0A6G1L3V8_9PEZI|nr:hypothetical protein EJ03DRAFT_276268 [Teratosphaeria nubilosa]
MTPRSVKRSSKTHPGQSYAPEVHPGPPVDEHGIINVAAHGDMVLSVELDDKDAARFRVSQPGLKRHSKVFERLLEPGRFGEGTRVEDELKILRARYNSTLEVPSNELPVVKVKDIGRISHVRSIAALFADFLYVLHGKETVSFPPVPNLANLAIAADFFDAIEVLKSYVKRKKMLQAADGKMKADGTLSEEKVRQRLLVAIMLDYPPWLERYSIRLITKGWAGKEADISAPLWWDLPMRIEEELAYRRECILDTMQSLQTHFLGLYTARERQCKLGYDSSAQCDSFQLGEMVRFFTRIGTMRFQGAIFDTSEPAEPYGGNIHELLDTLRQVPEYQIDRNHTHCGIRTRITPMLDTLERLVGQLGICPICLEEDRATYLWIDAKRSLLWRKAAPMAVPQGHRSRHVELREVFTATERDWGR